MFHSDFYFNGIRKRAFEFFNARFQVLYMIYFSLEYYSEIDHNFDWFVRKN